MDNHTHFPTFWLLFALLCSVSTKSECTIGPQRKPSNRFYSRDYDAKHSDVRQENNDMLEDIAETLSSNPSAASGGVSEMIASTMAMPSGPASIDGSVFSNVPMESSPLMETPMVSATSFAGISSSMEGGPMASMSPIVSNDVSIILSSPSPDMPSPTTTPIITELISVVFPTMTMEPEPSLQIPAPSQTDDVSPGASPTQLDQETMDPMMSVPPSEFPSIPPGDGLTDMPLVSGSPVFGVSPIPSNIIDEGVAASVFATLPSTMTEEPTPSMDTQMPVPPEEASPDPSMTVLPQSSLFLGTPLASFVPMASEASHDSNADETPTPSFMTGIFLTPQASLTPEASGLVGPEPLPSSASAGLFGPALPGSLDMSNEGMEEIDEDDPMISPGATDGEMTPTTSFSPPTMTMTVMPSATPSVSASATPSTSSSPSVSATASPSVSATASPSVSATASPSMSASASPSMSATASPSMSSSLTPSASASTSISPSMSTSMTPSASASVTPSASESATPSPSTSPMVDVDESPVPPTRTPRPTRRPKRPSNRPPNRRPKRPQRPKRGPKQRPTRARTYEAAYESVSGIESETLRVGPRPLQKWLDSGTEEARKIVWGVGPHMPE